MIAFPASVKVWIADGVTNMRCGMNPAETVRAIATLLAPPAASGPGLAEFPLPPEARVPLEQMLADLRAWQAGDIPWRDVSRGLLLAGPPGLRQDRDPPPDRARSRGCGAGCVAQPLGGQRGAVLRRHPRDAHPAAPLADRHRPPRSSGPLNRSTAMTMTSDDSYYDALFLWAFESPPIGRPSRSVPAVRIGPSGKLPRILVDGRLYPVIGIAPSGWLSTVGLSWCRFTGTRATIPLISGACKPILSRLLDDHRRFNAALHRHAARPDTGFCAGLPETDLGGGRCAIRPDDITVPKVRTALRRFLDQGQR